MVDPGLTLRLRQIQWEYDNRMAEIDWHSETMRRIINLEYKVDILIIWLRLSLVSLGFLAVALLGVLWSRI